MNDSHAIRAPLGSGNRAPAFILFIDIPKATPFLAGLAERGLQPLLIVPTAHSVMERAAMSFVGRSDHPFGTIADLSMLEPDDMASILATVDRWSTTFDIKGILATCEVFTEIAAVAADYLGLPGVGLRAGRVCRSKFLQRLYLGEWSPRSTLLQPRDRGNAAEKAHGRYPVVVKPTSLYSSIGVRAIRNERELLNYLDAHQDMDLLIEEQVTGREYSVETLSVDGRVIFTSITEKRTNEAFGSCFVEMGHTVPAANLAEDESARLLAAHRAVLSRLELRTGMAHAEYRITPDGGVILMEIGARPPGGGLLQLYHLATGVPMEAVVLDVALGIPVEPPVPSRWARQIYLEHSPGQLCAVQNDMAAGPEPTWAANRGMWPPLRPVKPGAPPTVHQVLILKNPGDELTLIGDSLDRAVSVTFDAPTVASLDDLEESVRLSVKVTG
jgi:ATP-grasp domain